MMVSDTKNKTAINIYSKSRDSGEAVRLITDFIIDTYGRSRKDAQLEAITIVKKILEVTNKREQS